jgi:CheY-like chemotaxis protein
LNGINGLDLLSAVRKNHRLDNVKIVMTSGEDCEDACFEAGANGFFLKPYNPIDLLNWLHSKE